MKTQNNQGMKMALTIWTGLRPTYYIGEDTIYYLEATAEDKANEYKITVNNDKVTKTLNDTCTVEGAGCSTW